MALYVPNAGEIKALEWALKSAGTDMKLKIFQNDVALSPTMTAADLTEATFTGYTARTLTRATWGAAFTNGDGKAQINYGTDQVYTFASSQTIYGHYFTDDADNLIAVEKYSLARAQVSGNEFTIQPRLTFTTESGLSGIVTNEGEKALLDWMFRGTGENLVLHLFKTNVTPTATSIVADFTESDFTGYVTKTLTRASWNVGSTDGAGKGLLEYSADQTYSPTTDQDLWGYYLVSATGGVLIAAENYGAARAVVNGDTLTIQPKVTLKSET